MSLCGRGVRLLLGTSPKAQANSETGLRPEVAVEVPHAPTAALVLGVPVAIAAPMKLRTKPATTVTRRGGMQLHNVAPVGFTSMLLLAGCDVPATLRCI